MVDENATNRKILAGHLKVFGAVPALASSATEALDLLRNAVEQSAPFEVALLDHDMPDCDGAELGRRINSDASLKCTRLVMLTSSGNRGDVSRFAEIGFAGYLLKPVAQHDLVDTLMVVLGASAEQWHARTNPIVTAEALVSLRASAPQRRVLLAEDNKINQRVACRMLEKMGYFVDVVGDGGEAVSAWARGGYDLILMDCQMPDMDGYAATREIRRRESGAVRIPIVALTAHAMKGADNECFAAGMDFYVTKPVDSDHLRKCLEKALTRPGDTAAA